MAIIGVGVGDIGMGADGVIIAVGVGAVVVIFTDTATIGGMVAGAATAIGIGTDDATGIIERHFVDFSFIGFQAVEQAAKAR